MTSILVVAGVLIALRLLLVRYNRVTRLKNFRANASRLTYEEARQRYQAHCRNLGSPRLDPGRWARPQAVATAIEQAEFYYERMIELETGHAGPAVRLSIRPTLLGLHKAGVTRRLPQP